MGAQGAQGAQGAEGAQDFGAQSGEESEGFEDGPENEGPEEMEAADGFEVSAPALDESDELRRDRPEPVENDELDAPSTLDENKVPEPPAGSSDDDLQ
jgi:hypothetical protein